MVRRPARTRAQAFKAKVALAAIDLAPVSVDTHLSDGDDQR
jgi:hypothetical protein